MTETKGALMVYEARDGQTIELNFDTIRRYLVQGHPEYVVASEFMYFMGVAKSGGMNPFKRDCWLIKYSQKDNAQIITAIGFLRSRAKAQRDCKGWKSGIIVMRDKQLVYSDGLKLPGDELLGGWAKGKPEGWDEYATIEVNLDGYIKKTREGQITAFWKPEKQATQIEKVAESQLLRKLWPDEFQNIYTDAEISPDDGTRGLPEIPEETGQAGEGEAIDPDAHEEFDTAISKLKALNLDRLADYVKFAAEHSDLTVYELKQKAIEQFESFLDSFRTWEVKHYPAEGKTETTEKDPIRE
ncbi:recombinase RecT, partial [bacterium]|nr:recombinase RecT [bacterium]